MVTQLFIVLLLLLVVAAAAWCGRYCLMYQPWAPGGSKVFNWWLKTECREAWGRVVMAVGMLSFVWVLFLQNIPLSKGAYLASLVVMLIYQWTIVASGEFGRARSRAIELWEQRRRPILFRVRHDGEELPNMSLEQVCELITSSELTRSVELGFTCNDVWHPLSYFEEKGMIVLRTI